MLYPQQNAQRSLSDLSGLWDFQLDPQNVGQDEGWFNGLDAPRSIAVPASWNEQFQDTRDYMGRVWYVRQMHLPTSWQGQQIFIRVGSANYAAKVWINGQLVGSHEGGHLPFVLDITEKVAFDGPTTVAISVENELKPDRVPPGNAEGGLSAFMRGFPNTSFDFFPYGGLHRPVLLFAVPPRHVVDARVVTEIEGDDGVVRVKVDASRAAGRGHIRLVGTEASAELAFDGGVAHAELQVPNARLWSPDDPHLYQLEIVLTEDDVVVDRYTLSVGIRTVEVRGHELLLNGQPIELRGFGKHEDSPIHGRGLNLPQLVKDTALFKWIGANSYRTAHYPYSEEAMMMADRQGILIVNEIPAVGLAFDDGDEAIAERLRMCKKQIHELIARDKNHPSVIMWSVANEPFPPDMMQRFRAQGAPPPVAQSTTDFFAALFEETRALDSTRPITLVGVMGGPVEWLALSDVIFINRYYGWYSQSGQIEEGIAALERELDALYEQLGKPLVVSEFGTDTLAGAHADPPEMWTEEYQVEFISRYLDVADARPFVAGMHIWNFADFKTGQGTLRTVGMNHKGVFTRDRRPKMAAHMLRKRWT